LLLPSGRRASIRSTGAFTLGCVLGASTTAAVVALLGALLAWVPLVLRCSLLVVIALVLLARQLGLVGFDLPQNRRQIPVQVFDRRQFWRGALQFGFELGTGIRTYLPNGSAHLLAAALFLTVPPWPVVAAVGVLFGTSRAAVVVVGNAAPDLVRGRRASMWGRFGPVAVTAGVVAALVLSVDAGWPR
jgi:hypothetical protein